MYQGTLPPVSNKESWSETVELYDDTTGEKIDLSGAVDIIVKVQDDGADVLSASLLGGTVSLSSDNLTASFTFSASQMGALEAKTHDLGIRIVNTDDTDVIQLVLGQLPVLDGI